MSVTEEHRETSPAGKVKIRTYKVFREVVIDNRSEQFSPKRLLEEVGEFDAEKADEAMGLAAEKTQDTETNEVQYHATPVSNWHSKKGRRKTVFEFS